MIDLKMLMLSEYPRKKIEGCPFTGWQIEGPSF
jgi:hypothetical protein